MDDYVMCMSCGHTCPYDEVETGIPDDFDIHAGENYQYYLDTPSRCPACGNDMGL